MNSSRVEWVGVGGGCNIIVSYSNMKRYILLVCKMLLVHQKTVSRTHYNQLLPLTFVIRPSALSIWFAPEMAKKGKEIIEHSDRSVSEVSIYRKLIR